MRMLLAAVSVSVMTIPAFADEPLKTAADFAGKWQIAFQNGEGVIVNKPVVSCSDPAVIEKIDEDSIHAQTPGGDMGYWQVRSFSGKNPWWAEDANGNSLNAEAMVAKWTSPTTFILADRRSNMGKYDFASAKEWTRCPD